MPLLTGHLRRADEIAAALRARGLGAGTEEPLPPAAPAGERAAAWIGGGAVAAGLGLVALARWRHAGGGFLPGLEPLYAWVLANV
jgi:energy-coupling factor transporter transmembrane protein EcfT